MKNFRTTAVLIPTLFVILTACGSSTTTSDSVPTVEVTSPDTSPVVTAPTATTTAPRKAPPVTTPPTTAPPTTAPAGQKPKINNFTVGAAPICFPEASDYEYPSTITASWNVSGATSIYIAIGDESGMYEQNLPASGSTEVPTQYPCLGDPGDAAAMTYYLVAENASGRTVKQETRTVG